MVDRIRLCRQLLNCLIGGLAIIIVIGCAQMLMQFLTECRQRTLHKCNGRMCAVALALLQYEHTHGRFPPIVQVDENGLPLHSWRAFANIDSRIWDQYHWDEPWNGLRNKHLTTKMPAGFSCPFDAGDQQPGTTSYYAIVRPTLRSSTEILLADIKNKDDRAYTVILVESNSIRAPWLKPIDIGSEELVKLLSTGKSDTITSNHPEGPALAFANGVVRRVSELSVEDKRKIMRQLSSQ